ALQTGQTWQGRLVSRKKDGTSFTEDVTLSPVRDEEGNIVSFVRVSRDITRELELEAQYFGAQKLASLGQLAGGIAHDFNNLLTAINGFAEILQLRLPPDDPNRQAVHHIYHAGQRAADLVNQLLAFSRKQIIQPKITSLNQVVQNITPMLQRLIGEDIILQTHLADDLWPVKIDPTQFEQVIMNLATNARDAMPHGGILLIETRNAVLDQAYADAHVGVDPGDYVMLAVSDTGTGMSEEVKARIFDPFFSTKEVGKGTGLGLATVYGVVKQNRGHIWVYSEPGQGTTFKLYVPRAEQPEAAAEEPAEFTPVQMPGGHETILLVEDNPEVRELVEHILRSQGYNLLQAEDGLNALLLARDYTGPIDLVITDVVMPNMSGPVMVSQLKQLKPGLKVLYMSGYTGNVLARHNVLEADTQFIGKPFSPVELTQKIRQVLDSNGS
ncbi:MAG: response regulator, partial [Chloroflexi bacterium]